MSKSRQPIAELLEKSNQGAALGIVCPKCKCVQFKEGQQVYGTVLVAGAVRRYRQCRACGHQFCTLEK